MKHHLVPLCPRAGAAEDRLTDWSRRSAWSATCLLAGQCPVPIRPRPEPAASLPPAPAVLLVTVLCARGQESPAFVKPRSFKNWIEFLNSLLAARGLRGCVWLSLDAVLRLLWSWGTGSRHLGSGVAAPGLSGSAACGIFLNQGSLLCPRHWQADS